MKSRLLIALAMLALVVLSACQTAAPTIVPTQEPQNPAATAPVQNQEQAYPQPQSQESVQQAQPAPEVLYPDIAGGGEVTWQQAKAMILNGEVAKVVESQDTVTLTLKDGRVLVTRPTQGTPAEIIESCGAPCQNIELSAQ
jgi:flagellar basal body L-ring protein FlgH